MQYKLLASDFDNTLVPFGEPCPRPAVVKAVKKMQAAGGKFVLSTGRGYCVINKQQLGGIRFDYAITNNGACVVDKDGAIIAEHPMTNEEMYALVDFCEDYNYPLQFNFRDACYVYCEYEALRNNYAKMGSSGLTCVDGEDQDRHLIDMPHSAFAAVPPEHVADFMAKYGHLNLNWMQQQMTEVTNLEERTGTLADALKGADIFVGVSAPNIVSKEMVASMNKDAILFAMANPVPEIMPDLAKEAGAKVVGTGRSDFPNQVNNVVAFPGIFKGALEGRATQITEEMKLAAANAIAGLVPEEELNENNILPEAFDPRVADTVSKAIKDLI